MFFQQSANKMLNNRMLMMAIIYKMKVKYTLPTLFVCLISCRIFEKKARKTEHSAF